MSKLSESTFWEKAETLEDKRDMQLISINIAQMIRLARMEKRYTQKQLAKIAKKQQSSIARVEAGLYVPTISYLNDLAIALDTYILIPQFKSVEHYFTEQCIETKRETQSIEVRSLDENFENFAYIPSGLTLNLQSI